MALLGVSRGLVFFVFAALATAFKFTIRDVEAGSYSLDYEIFAPNSTSADPEFEGTSTNTFTVADGQDLEFSPAF